MKSRTTRQTLLRPPQRPRLASTRRACLLVLTEAGLGRSHELVKGLSRIGRASEMEIAILDDEFVSRHHADVTYGDQGAQVLDRQSRNGTWVNGESVRESPLRDGDRLQVGATILKYIEADDLETAYMDAMYRLATHDGLTNLFTKRHFLEQLERTVDACRRDTSWLGVFMVDVDLFKKTNDTYGHLAGDRVLQEIAARFLGTIRKKDCLARYGGEEFSLVAPIASRDQAESLAERLLRLVAGKGVAHDDLSISVTVSIGGWAGPIEKTTVARDLLAEADAALYEAKQAGRNRVVLRPSQRTGE